MAERLSDVQARLHSLHELHEIVGAMRAIAAARVQEAQAALDGTRAYAQVIGDAIAEALPLLPEAPAPVIAAKRAPPEASCCSWPSTASPGRSTTSLRMAARRGRCRSRTVRGRQSWPRPDRGARPEASLGDRHGDPCRRCDRYREAHRGRALPSLRARQPRRRRDRVLPGIRDGGRRAIERQSLLPVDLGRFRRPRCDCPPLTNLPPRL